MAGSRRKHPRAVALNGVPPPTQENPPRPLRYEGVGPSRRQIEYLVQWKREGVETMEKRYANKARAYDRIGVMTSDEPWKFYGKLFDRTRTGDDTVWCEELDREITLREDAARRRAQFPPLEWIKVSRRVVTRTAWEAVEDVPVPPPTPVAVDLSAILNAGMQLPAALMPMLEQLGQTGEFTTQVTFGSDDVMYLPNGHLYDCGCTECVDEYVPF